MTSTLSDVILHVQICTADEKELVFLFCCHFQSRVHRVNAMGPTYLAFSAALVSCTVLFHQCV